MTTKSDKFYARIISSAFSFKTRNAYGSYEKALALLIKRKSVVESGYSKTTCEKYFRSALKVVDDALEFEKSYIQQLSSTDWFNSTTIDNINQTMEQYLKKQNPNAPAIFISRSIARIYYFNHLA